MESKKVPTWNEKTLFSKGLTVFGAIVSLATIILAITYFLGIWKNSINIIEPLVGVLMIIQWLQFRKYNKFTAYFSLGVGIFILIVSIVILLTH